MMDIDVLMCMPYLKEWYNKNFINNLSLLYSESASNRISNLSQNKQNEIYSVWTALIIAHTITTNNYSMSHVYYDSNTSSIISGTTQMLLSSMSSRNDNEYSKYLVELLVFTPNFSDLYVALTSDCNEFVRKSIGVFIESGKFNALEIKPIIHGTYDVYRNALSSDAHPNFIKKLYGWIRFYKENIDISAWSDIFIQDALKYSKDEWGALFKNNFDKKSNSDSFWLSEIDNESSYVITYLSFLIENGEKISNPSHVLKALKSYCENLAILTPEEHLYKKTIELILSTLDDSSIGSLKRYFSARIMQLTTSTAEKAAIIIHFGKIFNLRPTENDEIHFSYICLIDDIKDSRVLEWISLQDLKLNKWSDKNILEIESVLSRPPYNKYLSSLFSKVAKICNSRGIKSSEHESENNEMEIQ